jgi:ketosteroid isomerase-like protein
VTHDTSDTPSSNLELVRSILADWARGDFSSIDWAHPEMEFVMVDGPTPVRAGLAGMLEVSRDFLRAWDHWRMEADEYRELDGDRVLVLVRYSGRGKTSGMDLKQLRTTGAALFQVRDGKVTKFVRYFDRELALQDLGLTPEAGSSGS